MKTVKTEGLIYTDKDGIDWVDIENLKPNPVNKLLYGNETAETAKQEELAISMREEMDAGHPPNKQAIQIHKDGMIDSGHTRWSAAKMIGATALKAEYTTNPYPSDDTPYRNIKSLRSTNIYRTLTPSVKLDNYEETMHAYEIEFGYEMSAKERKGLLKELGVSKTTIDKLSTIKKLRPDLLKDIDHHGTSIEYAWNVATGNDVKVVPKKENGIDLYKLFTPEMKTRIIAYATTALRQYRSMTIKTKDGDFSPIEDELGWESTRFTGIVSDTFMWAMARVLTEVGKEVSSANGHPTDPDVYLINEDEKIEIKVTQFKGQGAGTTWKGGKGIREGEYLLVAHDADFTRLFVTFTTLDKNDWGKQGNVGTTLSLKNWWANKQDTDDFDFWKGEVYDASGIVQMQLEAIDESI